MEKPASGTGRTSDVTRPDAPAKHARRHIDRRREQVLRRRATCSPTSASTASSSRSSRSSCCSRSSPTASCSRRRTSQPRRAERLHPVLAIGMVMVIIAGHIDLSVGSVAAFVGASSRRVHGALGPALVARDHARRSRVGAAGRRLAGLLGGLRRHPGVHRDARGHAHLPRPRPGVLGNANIGSFPRVPRPRQRLLHRRSATFETDPLTLGVGALAIIALVVQQVRTRRGRQKYGQEVEPAAWFIAKLVLVVGAIGFFACAPPRTRASRSRGSSSACSCWSTASS